MIPGGVRRFNPQRYRYRRDHTRMGPFSTWAARVGILEWLREKTMNQQRNRFLLGLSVFAILGGAVWAADYIGVDKCKVCHKVQFESWAQLPHAKAFETLKPEDRGKAECLKCHAAGGQATLPGVQCESCHGPGSDYKSIPVMKDHAKALAAGLIVPDEARCRTCHEKAPHDVPAFDFAAAQAKGVHAHKAAAAK